MRPSSRRAYIWSGFRLILGSMSSHRSLIIAGLFAAGAGQASADICVSCTGPAATYDCAVKKAEQIESFAGSKALKKICLQVLKKNGQHSNCAVLEAGTCPGAATTIGWKEVKEALASPDEPEAAPAAKAPVTPVKPVAKDGPLKEPARVAPVAPKQEAAAGPPPPPLPAPEEETTVAGSIKGAAEKTWNCLSSLFGKC